MDVLAPALSSAKRPKSNYQGHPPVWRSVSIDAFANNEVRLLLVMGQESAGLWRKLWSRLGSLSTAHIT